MTMTDPISDMLARIRNALSAGHETVDVPASKEKQAIVEILKAEGYIRSYEVAAAGPGNKMVVTLKYGRDRQPAIKGLKRVSRPGIRVYAKANGLPKVLGGMGTAIISTSTGLMTDRQAKRHKLGGEVVAMVW